MTVKHIIQATRKHRRRATMVTEGRITIVERLKNTRNGGPMYFMQCGNMLFRTSPDAMVNLGMTNYENKLARVTLKETTPRARKLMAKGPARFNWTLDDIEQL